MLFLFLITAHTVTIDTQTQLYFTQKHNVSSWAQSRPEHSSERFPNASQQAPFHPPALRGPANMAPVPAPRMRRPPSRFRRIDRSRSGSAAWLRVRSVSRQVCGRRRAWISGLTTPFTSTTSMTRLRKKVRGVAERVFLRRPARCCSVPSCRSRLR